MNNLTGRWKNILAEDKPWTGLWSHYVRCQCGGIRTVDANCPACSAPPYDLTPKVIELPSGEKHTLPATFQGAEGRYEDYELLSLMEREWKRPLPAASGSFVSGLSPRASMVIIYWTYFETRMRRLVSIGLADLPSRVAKELDDRYDTVKDHMTRLYQILYGVKYADDLNAVGATAIPGLLGEVHDCRNRFIHGEPKALSDALVQRVVDSLFDEHEAWVKVFNRRISLKKAS
ncbi:MAG: hypothetical protein Q8K71_02510 [Polaromonas sp.]|nr:hypothetical protein [Polaromonas sp.]